MDYIDKTTLLKLIESGVIIAVAFALFYGLRGRIQVFAQWARLPRLAFAPVRLTLRYAILIGAAVLLLGRWGFQVDTLVAVLGTILGLVAIGFVAVWSVLSNILCAFVLILFKPFSVGDEIEMTGGDGINGKVIDLSLIYTTLEIGPGETMLIPNNIFFQRTFKRRIGTATLSLDDQLRSNQPAQEARA